MNVDSVLVVNNHLSIDGMNVAMEKYQNKYRIPSARMQNWDYGANGAHFIIISHLLNWVILW